MERKLAAKRRKKEISHGGAEARRSRRREGEPQISTDSRSLFRERNTDRNVVPCFFYWFNFVRLFAAEIICASLLVPGAIGYCSVSVFP